MAVAIRQPYKWFEVFMQLELHHPIFLAHQHQIVLSDNLDASGMNWGEVRIFEFGRGGAGLPYFDGKFRLEGVGLGGKIEQAPQCGFHPNRCLAKNSAPQ
jgi:hypothetical protein